MKTSSLLSACANWLAGQASLAGSVGAVVAAGVGAGGCGSGVGVVVVDGVSTPGVGWFELEVTGGFRTGQADDLASNETVQEYLNYSLRAARAYLDGPWSAASSAAASIANRQS